MANVYKSSDLIRSIKRRAMIPSDQNTFEPEDFLEMANEEIDYFAVPRLLRTHEEYLVTSIDFELVEGQNRYPIPSRAVGNKLRDVAFVDTSSESNEVLYELSRISLEELSDYRYGTVDGSNSLFYIEGNDIVLLGDFPVANSGLRMYFYLKPNSLVSAEETGTITGIDTVTGVITLSVFPTDFSSIPDMDFIMSNSPNKIMKFDITPQSVNSVTKSVTFDPDDLPTNLQVGDYLNVKGETLVPQLPEEFHPIIAQRVAVACLEALGDTEGLQIAQKRLEMMEIASNDLIDNRVEGAPQKIKPRHGVLNEAVTGRYKYGRTSR